MKVKITHILLVSFIILGSIACEDDKYTPGYKDFLNINSFSIDGIEGEIDHKKATISLVMPMGTDLSSLTPDITFESGATVTPASGQAQNFFTSKQYVVVNNGMYRTYKVDVSELRLGITGFAIGNHKGFVDDFSKTIKVYMPAGTDVTALSPSVQTTEGATLTPANFSVINFTNPVDYVVEKSGNKMEYKASIVFGEAPLTIYDGEEVSPNWIIIGNGDINSSWDNPNPSVLNRTEKCATTWRNATDDTWQGGGLWGLDINPAIYKYFSVLILKQHAGNVQMEIQGLYANGEGAPNQYLKQPYSSESLGKWQRLTFELPANHGYAKIHGLLIAPHADDTKNDPNFIGHRVYWDQVMVFEKK